MDGLLPESKPPNDSSDKYPSQGFVKFGSVKFANFRVRSNLDDHSRPRI